MEWLSSPRNKLLAGAAAMAALAFLTTGSALNVAQQARWLLLALCTVGLALWWMGARKVAGAPALAEPLRVIGRGALSARCGVALVEVAGRAFLVVHGEGFAEVRDASAPRGQGGAA